MKRNFFTLTYSNDTVRLVKITGKSIDSVSSGSISAGVINAGKIERIKIFSDLIGELKSKAKPKRITQSEVIAALPEEKVFLKTIEIPKMPLEKVDSAITYQIESVIPFKIKEVYFNWKIIGTKENSLVVLIAACEKSIVDNLFESLVLAKCKPLIITFPSAGLANLLSGSNKLVAIVDLSRQNNISVVIAKNKDVHFSTSRHIDSDYRGLERIIEETINYYKKKYLNEEIGQILIFGPPNLSSIEERIAKRVSQDIKIGNSQDIKIIRNIKPEYISYIDNLGLNLSLESLSLSPPEVRENAKNENINYKLSSIVNYFILFTIFLAFSYVLLWGKIYYDNLNLSKEYAQLQSIETSSKQEELEAQIQKFNAKIAIIKTIPLNNSLTTDLIKNIMSSADANIILKEINIESNKNVKIKGVAKNRNDLIIFKDNLNQLQSLNKINLPITALEKNEDLDFELTTSKK